MTMQVLALYLLAMLAAAACWLVPRRWAMDFMALVTIAALAWFSWPTLIWLLGASVLIWLGLLAGQKSGRKGLVACASGIVLLGLFAAAQFTSGIMWIGASFFTLRLLHVVGDWWTGSLAVPTLANLLRYQLFLPVIVVGPIHRFQNFQRQVQRRRWSSGDFFSGLERCLMGFFAAHVLGVSVMGRADLSIQAFFTQPDGFAEIWALSALGWVRLYFIFAGLTAVALGASLMAGLRLEENFNAPWRATSLLDFWNRWHISLTSWSRDYAYRPVMALTRNPIAGVLAAMLVIGLWHDLSFYYVAWSFWQALGIVLSRSAGRWLPPQLIPAPLRQAVVMLGILAWLSLARPVITIILGIDFDTSLSFL